MRATATPSLVRKGKQRLLNGCAITAGMMALAYGGPALAQVAANPVYVSAGAGTSINSNGGTKTTTVNVTAAQTIINWIPTDTAATGGDINVLPSDSIWNFNGSGSYIVLNRFVNGAGGALSRQVALNGTINSTNTATSGGQGGSIWFYNAGGLLIGNTGVINVGSLVLTSNDIQTTGGLLDPTTGAIRFRGASGSTSTVTVNGAINAEQALAQAGSSYVALVAPRIVQAGAVSVNGSAAYVAAEQADIRINGGLFDINVLVGAEGGNVITHTGTTTGPEQQTGGLAQRIYMVAIPKNVAVGMLVSGQVGYQDGATTAITNSDGSIVLSAGYNVSAGAINTTPVNATAANITINDIILRSNTLAHASGAFLAQPLATLPAVGGPVTAVPPPHLGRFLVQGNGTFIGDASSTLNITGNRLAGASGVLTIQSGGRGGVPGNASVNVDGGLLLTVGGLSVIADGAADATTGNGRGGTAALTVSGGATAITNALLVSAVGNGGVSATGAGGTGTGGTARINVSGTGTQLSASSLSVDARGFGGGLTTDVSGVTTAADNGGDGVGGTALLTVDTAGSLNASTSVNVDASGFGEIGNVQSGNGTGGTGRVSINGAGTAFTTPSTLINAAGYGGGVSQRSPSGLFSANGGDGTGGTAELLINTNASTSLSLGDVGLNVVAAGGGAGNAENTTAGDAEAGTANVSIDGGANVQLTGLGINARADGGSATSPTGLTGRSGNGIGGNVDVTVQGGSTLQVGNAVFIDASGNTSNGENSGSGAGGNVAITATGGSAITINDVLSVNVFGGSFAAGLPQSAGTGTGGNVDFLADLSGTISAANYSVDARGGVANVVGTNGAARGGRITLTSLNGGLIESTSDGIDFFSVSAQTGYSNTGSSANGGDITIFANEGSIALANPDIQASGVSGGALGPNAAIPIGTGGNIIIRTGFDSSSQISFGSLNAEADGLTQAFVEGAGNEFEPAGDGQGGTITVEANGGGFTAFGPMNLSADGTGGIGRGTTGRGGTATFTQIGGVVQVGDLSISANGYGGFAMTQSGDGFGGTATLTLQGGTFTGSDVSVSASGIGGDGFNGDDFDSANPLTPGSAGNGQGGTATINIDGDAVVDTAVLAAYASGNGGVGGNFFSFNGTPGTGGIGGTGTGGTATINLIAGELDTDAAFADAGGFGGRGGSILVSSSSGFSTGAGVGGSGGNGQGGTATVNLGGTLLNVSESLGSRSGASGGNGGSGSVGGNGGNAFGGVAQAIVNDYDAGSLALILDTSAFGGNGGDGFDGDAGGGGLAQGGRSRIEAIGPNASISVSQSNFETGGNGGNGGTAYTDFFSRPAVGGSGGNGGDGIGGEIEIVATNGATVGLGEVSSSGGTFNSIGTGGTGGRGADNPGTITLPGPDGIPGTPDDVTQGLRGGNGGIGGGGTGGIVSLIANGGTITSNGTPVSIAVSGVSGNGGDGGSGLAGAGNCCTSFIDTGGRVVFQALTTSGGTGSILLGDTVIQANGGLAGRIDMFAQGNITMASLAADAFGFAFATNNDIDVQPAGIFLSANGGTIRTTGDMTLRTGSSVGAYMQGSGRVNAGGNLTIEAGDQVHLRHDMRGDAANPTLYATGNLSISAANSIVGGQGSLLGAGNTLTLATTTPTGRIAVDRLDGTDISITAGGSVSVEHSEAVNDFTANVGSFRTGLNSIITGGDIDITSVGAVDLGNSTAGGYVRVDGQSIVFNNINAGFFVDLTANGTATGAEGIRGAAINSGSSVFLSGNSIDIDLVDSDGFLSATASGGNVAIDQATARFGIGVQAQGDITGSYAGGEDIFLSAGGDIIASAAAIGNGSSSSSGFPTTASVYATAGGDIIMTNSQATGMFGVNAGGSVDIDGAAVGEDMLILSQGTATLANVSVGDDLDVRAVGNITATNVRTTGSGPDTHILSYLPASGFTISQGEGNSAINGSDLTLTSSAGSIDATGLSAGDDILLSANGTIGVNGATTLGFGTTGGDSSIRTTGGDTTLANLDAFSDVVVNSTGTANIAGTIDAGRDVTIDANDVTIADIVVSSQVFDTIAAGGSIAITSANDITGGALTAGGDLTLTADGMIAINQGESGDGAAMTLTGATGISADQLYSRGVTTLTANDGAIQVNNLNSLGNVSVIADSLNIGTNGPIEFASIVTDVGDAVIRSNNRLIVDSASIAGTARFSNTGEHMIIVSLNAANVDFDANEMITMTNVTATNNIDADAGGMILVNGVVTGQNISLASGDITIASNGRVGTAGVTQALSIENNDNDNQTFVGGTGTRNGFHIDADELTRIFGRDVQIFAPEVSAIQPASLGGSALPDVVVDTFTMTGGSSGSNIGANGSLTISTPGKMRVIGNVQLTGLTDTNALNLVADNALEVILGQGTIRLLGANNAPGGVLTMESDDIIVATTAAITDVANATSIDAISSRLAQNDGVVLDEGALFARRIAFDVVGGVYVQNSGAGTDFGQRRGLTFGAGGLDVLTEGPSRIVLNGVHLGANGQVTGIDTISLLTIGGSPVPSGATGSLGFDPRSTLNGCFIANVTSCSMSSVEIDRMFPVQDVIEDEDSDDSGDGTTLPTALITMRDLDPLTGEPLLDDPVTGAGNDDLWTPTTDSQTP